MNKQWFLEMIAGLDRQLQMAKLRGNTTVPLAPSAPADSYVGTQVLCFLQEELEIGGFKVNLLF